MKSSSGGVPLVVPASPLGECARNPYASVHQLAVRGEAALSFSELFLETFNVFAHFTKQRVTGEGLTPGLSQPSPRPGDLRSPSDPASRDVPVWANGGLYPLLEATSP